MQRQSNMQQVEAAHGQQQFECRAPRGIFYNGTWYNTEALQQLPSCVLPETQWQQQQQQQQQQYAHATLQPGLHLQQGLQLVVAEVSPQLPLQSSRSHHQLCSCERGQPLSMMHGQCTHQCNYEAVIEQQQQHLQQLTAQHIQTPLMQPLPQQFHQELQQQVDQQQQPQYFIQQQLELTHLNQQQQWCYSTQVQATDSPQQEIQQELPQQELQLQQQQHFIHQQHSYQQHSYQQQLPQQQLQLELQQQQHFMQTQLESHQLHQQHQQNSNQQQLQLQQQYCYSVEKEIQQHLPQQQLESQELQQHEQHSNQQEQQQCCNSTQFQQQQQLQQQLEHQTQSQQQLQQAQLQQQQQQQDFVQQQLESQQLQQHQQDSNEQQQLEQCCYSTQLEFPQKEMQQQLPQLQLESQQLQQHQQDSNEQQQLEQCCYSTQIEFPQKEMQQQLPQLQFESQQLQQHSNEQQEQKDSEQCCYLTQVQDTQSPQQQMQQKLEQQPPAEQQFQQQPYFVQQQLESQQLQQHQQQQCCHSTQLEQQLPQQLQQSHPQQQQQQQPLICQQHYLPDQTNNYRPQSSSTTPTSFPSSPSSILTPQPVNDPKIIELDMSSLSKVHITRTFGRLVISIYRQTELDDELPNRVIINGQVLSSDDSSNGQSMRQLYVNSATQTPTEEEIQTETSMSTDASDEADLEELLQYTTAAVATVNQSKSNVQTEPEQFRAPRRVAKQQQPMLQHTPLKKAPKWTKPAKRIAREFQNSPESNKTLLNPIHQENEQMPQENSEGILKKIEVVNSETIQVSMLQKESSTNLQKVKQMQMQQEESGRVLRKIEQVQVPQKRSETIIQKIEQVQLSEKKSTTNLHKIKEKEMLQEHNSNTILKKIEKTNLQKIEQIPIQQKDSGRILQKIDAVGVPQKEPRTNLNNIKEKQMTQKKPETILQKIEQMPLPQNEQKIGQIQQEKSERVLQKIDVVQMPQEKPTTDKVKTKSDSDSNNIDNLIKQTALGIGGSQQPQLALGQQDREEEWPELSVQQATPSARLRKSQSSPQPIVNQKCNGMRSPPSFPDDYPIGEPKLPQSIFKQMYKRKSSQSKTIEQSTKQETPPLRSQSVDNVKRSWNIKTYQRINHNSDECPQSNAIRQIRSPTRKYQSAQSSQSLVNQQKNLTRCQQGATKPITMKCRSKAQLIAVHQSDVNQAATRNDQVVNQPKSSSNQASIQSGNQKHKSTPKAMSKEKSEQQSNVNQTVNLKSPSIPRFGLDESKTSKAITDQPKKKSNGAFESNANQATDAKESEVHQSMNLSAGNEKPCSESVNQPEVSLNPEMDNDTKPSTSQNVEALVIRKTNNGRKQKTPMSKFERKALRRELQNVQLAARKSEENSQSTEEVLQPVEVQHDVEEVKRNQQSTEVDQHLKDIPQPMELESSDEIKPKEEPKETEPSDEDPELNNPLLSGVSCKIMRGHILRIAKKINSL